MWLRKVWYFAGFQARLFRWTKDFSPVSEPSITPVWIRFLLLPIHLFKPEKLYTLASVAGNPLKLDTATALAKHLARPSEARVCVEMDVQKNIPDRVWIGSKERGKWQKLEIEERPAYCSKCKKLGHRLEDCQPQIKTRIKPIKAAPIQAKKPQNEWAVVSRSKGLQIREMNDDQELGGKNMDSLNRKGKGGQEIEKELANKGKGVVPGSIPEICSVEDLDPQVSEQGVIQSLRQDEPQLIQVDDGKDKEEIGPSRPSVAQPQMETQLEKLTMEKSSEPQQSPGNLREAGNMKPEQEGACAVEESPSAEKDCAIYEKAKQGQTDQNETGLQEEDLNAGTDEKEKELAQASELPHSSENVDENIPRDGQARIGAVAEGVTDQHNSPGREQNPTHTKGTPTQARKKSTPTLLQKAESGSNLQELTTDSEGESMMFEEKEFTKLAGGKEGISELKPKVFKMGRKNSASGSKAKGTSESKMTLRQKDTRQVPNRYLND